MFCLCKYKIKKKTQNTDKTVCGAGIYFFKLKNPPIFYATKISKSESQNS